MKKTFISIIMLILFGLSMNAQLRVNSTGHVLVGDSTDGLSAGLTVNTRGTHSGLITAQSSTVGFKSSTFGNRKENTAVFGEATNTPLFFQTTTSILKTVNTGVYGLAGSNMMNIGVLGALSNGVTNGAGVYGTSRANAGTNCGGKYAGFFEGDTKTTGLMAGFLTNYMDKSNDESYSSTAMTDVLDGLADIDVMEYNPQHIYPFLQGGNAVGTEAVADPPVTLVGEGRHAVLDVESVKAAFPYLIRKDQQSVEHVNYTELIPVLLKAIQELKAQVDNLSGAGSTGGMVMMAPQRGTSGVSNSATATAGAKLFQNRPNPFTAQTEIRFTLPDDARDAYIYIFDMTGKTLRQIPVDASMQSVTINGYELSAGLYLYSLVVNGQEIETRRMILSK